MKSTSVTLLSVALLAAACGDGRGPAEAGPSQEEVLKTLTATDAAGQNTVELEVRSADPEALAAYGPGSFIVVPFSADETEAELKGTPHGPQAPDAKQLSEGGADVRTREGVSMRIIGERIAAGVAGYRLLDRTQSGYRDPFAVVYRYTSLNCAVVTRVSAFNNVYASIESQPSANGAWSTIAYRMDLERNEPLDVCDSGSYQIRARIERRNANDYDFFGHN